MSVCCTPTSSGGRFVDSHEMSTMETDDEERKKYQKTIVFNKHLPYADQLEEEAAGKIADIKRNLCTAVQNRDVTPGYIFWISRLSR